MEYDDGIQYNREDLPKTKKIYLKKIHHEKRTLLLCMNKHNFVIKIHTLWHSLR